MKRTFLLLVVLFVFSISAFAGYVPISNYAGCEGVGYRAFQNTETQEIICCAPDTACPADGGPGRRGTITKPNTDITFAKLFVYLYQGYLL